MVNFLIGTMVGAFIGTLVAGCLRSAAEDDKRNGWK